jgi:uncharacterized protein (TIGR02391 family)
VQKVVPLFRSGDYDTAVFQAFKQVEVAVREAANAKGGKYTDNDLGADLMRRAFHPQTGQLTDMNAVVPERESIAHLFHGAIGHAKNPASHRNVVHTAADAARLIVFAGYLLELVQSRLEESFSAFNP